MLLFSFVVHRRHRVLPRRRCRRGSCRARTPAQIYASTEGPEDVSFEGMLDAQQRVAEIVRQDENVEAFSSTVGAGGSDGRPATPAGCSSASSRATSGRCRPTR